MLIDIQNDEDRMDRAEQEREFYEAEAVSAIVGGLLARRPDECIDGTPLPRLVWEYICLHLDDEQSMRAIATLVAAANNRPEVREDARRALHDLYQRVAHHYVDFESSRRDWVALADEPHDY
jgi:hypothetical protein